MKERSLSSHKVVIPISDGGQWEVTDGWYAKKKNPDSESETGAIDSEAVWEAVLDAMENIYLDGLDDGKTKLARTRGSLRNFVEEQLKLHLSEITVEDGPQTDNQNRTPWRSP